MSVELYSQYEQDFINLLNNITRTSDNLSTASSKGKLRYILKNQNRFKGIRDIGGVK